MITNKDVRVENGNLILNGDKYPLDGQSPEAIMQIVEDNSDTTPTENSTAPITSGGVFTALAGKEDTLTFDNAPTAESANPVTSGGIFNTIGDLTQTGVTGATVAAQIGKISTTVGNIFTIQNSGTGSFPSLVENNQTWLVVGNRLNTSEGILLVVNNYEGTLSAVEVFKSTNMSYQTNTQGTVQLLYLNAGTGVQSCAIRLF